MQVSEEAEEYAFSYLEANYPSALPSMDYVIEALKAAPDAPAGDVGEYAESIADDLQAMLLVFTMDIRNKGLIQSAIDALRSLASDKERLERERPTEIDISQVEGEDTYDVTFFTNDGACAALVNVSPSRITAAISGGMTFSLPVPFEARAEAAEAQLARITGKG